MMMTEKEKWSAVEQRNSAYDGTFVFAVATTGIFCRPSCPARRPLARNVHFFETPAEAEAAGYRACRRCRPLSIAPVPPHRALAKAGVTPREWKSAQRVAELKTALRGGASVTEALYEAGYGASSRLYETAVSRMGMTPGQYRKGARGLAIRFVTAQCPLGRILVAATDRGICFVSLADSDHKLVQSLTTEFAGANIEPDSGNLGETVATIVESLGSSPAAQALPLDLAGTAFQIRVWQELRKIERGKTRTYSDIAAAIGQPTAVRAVARACATNPAALVVPCHRVVRTDGSLAGYRWGVNRKRTLLRREAY